MIWNRKDTTPQYKNDELVRTPFFCWTPKNTEEGKRVWLETVIAERKWYIAHHMGSAFWDPNYGDHRGNDDFNRARYYLTDKQKAKLGITW